MAEGKKGFVLYCDYIHTFKHLTKDQRSDVIMWIFEYVNDLNPKPLEGLLMAVVEPIVRQLKRDLIKYEERADRSRQNGLKGGRPKKSENPKKPKETQQVNSKPKKPDTDTVTVTVIVKDILLKKETKSLFNEWLEYRKQIKKPIKAEKTLLSLAKRIEKEGAARSKEVINYSIENGYQGLFWDRTTDQKVISINSKTMQKISKYD